MTGIPFPISGIVYDINGSTALSNVNVNLYSETNEEQLSTSHQGTTNAAGEYTIDGANLSSGVSNSDILVIVTTKTNSTRNTTKIKEHRFTADTSQGYYEKNLTLTYYNVCDLIVDILNDNWQNGRTDLITPAIKKIIDLKKVDLQYDASSTPSVLIYQREAIPEKNSIGKESRKITFPVSIDIRCMKSFIHTEKVKHEADRILNSKIINPTSKHNIIDPDGRWTDLSDKTRLMWRYVMEVNVEMLNASRINLWWD